MASLMGSRLSAGSCFSTRTAPLRHVAYAPRLQPVASPSVVLPSCSFMGGPFTSSVLRPQPVVGRGALVIMANAKKSLGCTKQGTRRARRRTSGFRTRMASPTGRKVLKLRRKKGRKCLVPASVKSTGGKKM